MPLTTPAARRTLLLSALCGAVLLLGTNGCYYDNEAELYPSTYCDTTLVTYATKVVPIIQANCATPGCHVNGGQGSGDFTNYAGVKAKVDNGEFQADVFVNKTMPPSSSMSSCDIQVLKIWVDHGAPNN